MLGDVLSEHSVARKRAADGSGPRRETTNRSEIRVSQVDRAAGCVSQTEGFSLASVARNSGSLPDSYREK